MNVPDALSPYTAKTYTRDAGEATLILGVRDSLDGNLIALVVHHGRAGGTGRFERSSDVATRFRFDALYRQWAADCAGEFAARRNRPPGIRSR